MKFKKLFEGVVRNKNNGKLEISKLANGNYKAKSERYTRAFPKDKITRFFKLLDAKRRGQEDPDKVLSSVDAYLGQNHGKPAIVTINKQKDLYKLGSQVAQNPSSTPVKEPEKKEYQPDLFD